MFRISKNKAFTLIELLVAISIIAILTAVVITSMSSSRPKARDAKRVSDVAQLQLALEQYFDRNNVYPVSSNYGTGGPGLTALVTGGYLSSLPKDPQTNTSDNYITYVSSPSSYDYVLKVQLERYYGEGINTTGNESVYGQTCSIALNEYCVRSK